MRERSEKLFGFPPGADTNKVREGKPGAHVDELPPDVSEETDPIWQEEIGETLGFDSYEAFRQAVVALSAWSGS